MKKLLLFWAIIFFISCKTEQPPTPVIFYTATIYLPNGEIDCYDIVEFYDYSSGGLRLADFDGDVKIYWNIPVILERKEK